MSDKAEKKPEATPASGADKKDAGEVIFFYFGEGGGGIMFGPFGVDLSVKFVVNQFDLPVAHSVNMIPICVRGTLTF
jgi:hypothetical protein